MKGARFTLLFILSVFLHFSLFANTFQVSKEKEYDGIIISVKPGKDVNKVLTEVIKELTLSNVALSDLKTTKEQEF